MTHSDQETENGIEGNVSTAFQAGSMAITLGSPAKPPRGRGFWLATAAGTALAVAAVSTLALELVSPSEPVKEIPVAITSENPAETTTATSEPTAVPTSRAPRPAQPPVVPRAPGTTTTTTPLPTSTVPQEAAPPPAPSGDGVRFSGRLRFASFHLDPVPPRDVPESNVWALTPTRLHGDPGYWLAEWFAEGVPGRAECLAHLGENATLDADNVVVGSRVCGKTPAGRIFRIEVTALDGSAITGQVVVWE